MMKLSDKARTPSKIFQCAVKDWPLLFDILFTGTDVDEDGGPIPPNEVLVIASRDGIEQLQRVFPGMAIAWRPLDEFCHWATDLPGWRECCVKVKDVISGEINIPHKLPERLIKPQPGCTISKNQLAMICMTAVNDLHGRAAIFDENTGVVQGQMPDQTQFTKH
jgi:hypothetical protein